MFQLSRFTIVVLLACIAAGCMNGRSTSSPPAAREAVFPTFSRDSTLGPDRKNRIWQNARISLEVEEIDPAVTEILSYVKSSDGHVESNVENPHLGTILQLRLPAELAEDVLKAIEQLGTFTVLQSESQDITEPLTISELRLNRKMAQRDRLSDLMEQAARVEDLLAIETDLKEAQSDIATLQSKVKSLKDMIAFPAIELTVQQRKEPPQKILGPLGALLKGISWTVGKLFVIRKDVPTAGPQTVQPPPPPVLFPSTSANLNYTVQEGDTLEGICRLFVVSSDHVLQVNPSLRYKELIPGEIILIPPM